MTDAHLAGKVRQHDGTILQLNAEGGIRKCFDGSPDRLLFLGSVQGNTTLCATRTQSSVILAKGPISVNSASLRAGLLIVGKLHDDIVRVRWNSGDPERRQFHVG